jgi:hypothetical protein
MPHKISFVRRWHKADLLEMIDCPYQPGNLKITKKACLKRRKASTEGQPFQTIHNEFFLYTVRQGLLTCKSCPVGE